MRTYGRITLGNGADGLPIKRWVKVETDAAGFNDMVYLTTLAQVLLLNINESPFFADWGIPALDSFMQQVHPNFYVGLTQQRFSKFFASLIISHRNSDTPIYDINVTTHQGVKLNAELPVPI
jgi:hypothetical protein